MTNGDDGIPELVIVDEDDAVLDHLRRIQRAMLVHPEAGLALYHGLVEEGRLFAQTSDGSLWQERLRNSALLERALLVWQNASVWMTEEDSDAVAPSALVDAVSEVAMSNRRDALLEKLFRTLDQAPSGDE
jgi:hypothetical protein